MIHSATASAPASIGNVSVGFDVLGQAFDAVRDTVTAERVRGAGVSLGSVSGLVDFLPDRLEANTALTAAGPAVEAGTVGVVHRAGAVPTEQDEAGEAPGQAHVFQSAACQGDLVLEGNVELGMPLATADLGGAAQAEAVLDEAPGVAEAGGFDEGEGGHRGALEGVPGLAEAPGQVKSVQRAFFLRRTDAGQAFVDAMLGLEQDRALGLALAAAEGHELDGQAEETGEAAGFQFGRLRLQRSPQGF